MAVLDKIDMLFKDKETTIAKDLKMNLKNLIDSSSLTQEEALLNILAVARAKNNSSLQEIATSELEKSEEVTPESIQEALEIPGIMGMMNTYYKFRHFAKNADKSNEESYGPAKLRMMSLGKPQMGKERFEMLAFSISLLNGCEQCVNAHEAALKKAGVSQDKIHDLARLTSVTFATTQFFAF